MILSRSNLYQIPNKELELPSPEVFDLPEKILQFGTGVLLRGLVDFYVDQANKKGIFRGRIAVIKSTDKGNAQEFEDQDSLYTIYIKGVENSLIIEKKLISASISRVLSAARDWDKILDLARSPDLQIIVSNTTEIGISWVPEKVFEQTPNSFPGKLLAVLNHRFQKLKDPQNHGLAIIPTELIPENGKKLKEIVLRLAEYNKLPLDFLDWIDRYNSFNNSLVDRIVPGRPDLKNEKDLENQRGYKDSLNIMVEPYNLWAIEGDSKLTEVLTFAKTEKGVLIRPDIEIFRELKLRILNGSHTLGSGIALISEFRTVREAMENPGFTHYIEGLIFQETLDSIPSTIPNETKLTFAKNVLDRFRNPFIEHEWKNIALQYTSKMKLRVVPLIIRYFQDHRSIPRHIALGFAAYIRWMKVSEIEPNLFKGLLNHKEYILVDNHAGFYCDIWKYEISEMVDLILRNQALWDTDLTMITGFREAVLLNLTRILENEASILEDF